MTKVNNQRASSSTTTPSPKKNRLLRLLLWVLFAITAPLSPSLSFLSMHPVSKPLHAQLNFVIVIISTPPPPPFSLHVCRSPCRLFLLARDDGELDEPDAVAQHHVLSMTKNTRGVLIMSTTQPASSLPLLCWCRPTQSIPTRQPLLPPPPTNTHPASQHTLLPPSPTHQDGQRAPPDVAALEEDLDGP